MKDPVIGSDGITYERSAIEQWFALGNTISPMTRAPMASQSLVPNYALKALIEAGAAPPTTKKATTTGGAAPPITIGVTAIEGSRYHVTVSTEDVSDATLPTLFIDVLDISGSMGGSCVDTSKRGADSAAALSRANLVEHATATKIELLRPCDELALVLFDDHVEVPLQPIKMTPAGKAAAKSCLSKITARGGTNIWTGLQRGLAIAEAAADTNKNIVITLQTDGESDPQLNPPRGIVPTLQAWLDNHPTARVTIHTVGYGFGDRLDTKLLRQIADVGHGTYSYTPDGSMVGTVFIHMMANLMSCQAQDLRLLVPEAGIVEHIGFLQGGQPRTFIVTTSDPTFSVVVAGPAGTVAEATVTAASVPAAGPEASETVARLHLIQALREAVTKGFGAHLRDLRKFLEELPASPTTRALLTDLFDPDLYKGQIGKAFESAENWSRWGQHYVPTIISGHERQWPINFKDEGSKLYGSKTVRRLIDRGDEIFNSLPPPKPTAYSYSGASAAAPVSMSSLHNANGSCFLAGSRVAMAGGVTKRCDEIQPGDIDANGNIFACVVKSVVTYADVVRFDPSNPECGYTLWHPVFWTTPDGKGGWRHPAEVGIVERVQTDAIYNFVLTWPEELKRTGWATRPETITVDGRMTCVLGHEMTGPVIGHPYFGRKEAGKPHIIDDLAASEGWAEGRVTWRNIQLERDPATGLITRLIPGA